MGAKRQIGLAGQRRRRLEPQRRARRIVAGHQARRAAGVVLGRRQRPDQRLDLAPGDRPGAQQTGRPRQQGDHRRFDAEVAGSAIERGGRRRPGLGQGVGQGGGTWAPGKVGAGRDDRPGEGLEQGAGHRMGRNPDGDAIEPRAGEVTDRRAAGDRRDDGQRPRPEGPAQFDRAPIEGRDGGGSGGIEDMDDQRVEPRPALGRVEAPDGVGVGRVGGQAIDRFGGNDDQFAGGQGRGAAPSIASLSIAASPAQPDPLPDAPADLL